MIAGVNLTHPDRVLYAAQNITKRDLALYYESIGDWIVPHVAYRPLVIVRCPTGSDECFFQKHINETVPDVIGRVEIREEEGPALYMLANNLAGIVGLVQMGVLEIHTWGARSDNPEAPDRLVFDLDPDRGLEWARVVEAAKLTRARLEDLGLVAFVKTTGGKGLHVVVPLLRRHDWAQVKNFSKAVADDLVRTAPHAITATPSKAKRRGKIFFDYLRNSRGATAVAAFSTRARPGAPVSVPIHWEELSVELRSDDFNISTVPGRLQVLKQDPWGNYASAKQVLTQKMYKELGV